MILKCKLCGYEVDSPVGYANHFHLKHRVGPKSLFTCGFNNCNAQFSSIPGFRKHVSLSHSNSDISSKDSVVGSRGDADVEFKCPFPNCGFQALNASTFRSHKSRKHSKQSLPPTGTVDSQAPCDIFSDILPTLTEQGYNDINQEESDHDKGCDKSVEDDLFKDFVHLYLTLTSKYHIPESTVQFILDKYAALLHESQKILKSSLVASLCCEGSDKETVAKSVDRVLENEVMWKLHSPEGPMRSYHMRKNQYDYFFKVVSPVGFHLGLNESNTSRYHHYVPIKETLQVLFSDDSVYQQYTEMLDGTRKNDGVLRDLCDGLHYKNHEILSSDPSAIQLLLYQDDVELVNPLGSGKCKHKINNIFYTIGNLHSWNRLNTDPMQLVMVTREKDISYFGLNKVFHPLIAELKDLEKNGIDIRGTNVKVVLFALLGDNLGQHIVGGFVENFSSSQFFCRYCEEPRKDWLERWTRGTTIEEEESSDEDEVEGDGDDDSSSDSETSVNRQREGLVCEASIPIEAGGVQHTSRSRGNVQQYQAPLRTKLSYDKCASLVEEDPSKYPSGLKGVVARCMFNSLEFFHVIGGAAPCLAHELFSGIVDYDVYMMLDYFEKQYRLSKDFINRKFASFLFKGLESHDKPARIPLKGSRLGGHAIQNWILLRFLPILIGDKIANEDPVWKALILLIQIVQIVCSPAISSQALKRLKSLIPQYLDIRSKQFKKPLRPKHHFLEHYCFLIEQFGPLCRFSTMRFESNQQFFRNCVRASRNFRNLTLTLSRQYQHHQAALSGNKLYNNFPIVVEETESGLLELDEILKTSVQDAFGCESLVSALFVKAVRFRGTDYKVGHCLLLPDPSSIKNCTACKIEVLIVMGSSVYAIG